MVVGEAGVEVYYHQQWRLGTQWVEFAGAVSGGAWIYESRILDDDSTQFSTCVVKAPLPFPPLVGWGKHLMAYDFGFTVPDCATVVGVDYLIRISTGEVYPYTRYFGSRFQLGSGTALSTYRTNYLTTSWKNHRRARHDRDLHDIEATYGSPVTPALVNSANFGVAVAVGIDADSSPPERHKLAQINVCVDYAVPVVDRGTGDRLRNISRMRGRHLNRW